ETVRRLIGEYALAHDLTEQQAMAATLNQVADTLGPNARPAKEPSAAPVTEPHFNQADLNSALKTSRPASSQQEFPEMLKLFVSHSFRDLEFVKVIVEFLKAALKLSANDIRCTSLDGHRLPGGADTLTQLRREINNVSAFIGIISAVSLDSMYVAFELGARW